MRADVLLRIQSEIVEACTRLIQRHGPHVFDAVRNLACGIQPSELERARILSSEFKVYLRNSDQGLEVLPLYRFILKMTVRHNGRCELLPAGPQLPAPDSKPPRPF